MDAEVCPSCGASAVADESGDGFSRVCTACGVVLDAAPLQATGFTGDDDGLCFVSSTSRDTMSLRRDERGRSTHAAPARQRGVREPAPLPRLDQAGRR
ncbi:hypothetical protein MRX96_033247 [Rhipicephalus microplus]